MSVKSATPKAGTKGFQLAVLPNREDLNKAIAVNGFCHPKKCWHRMAVYSLMEHLEPGADHHVRVDAGHIKVNYRGWRYSADTPVHVKRSLMLFDAKRYDEVYIRTYKLRFRRTTKIIPISRARQDQINTARKERIAAGGDETRRGYPNLRKRVSGFSLSV
jgi:hypothetical protein